MDPFLAGCNPLQRNTLMLVQFHTIYFYSLWNNTSGRAALSHGVLWKPLGIANCASTMHVLQWLHSRRSVAELVRTALFVFFLPPWLWPQSSWNTAAGEHIFFFFLQRLMHINIVASSSSPRGPSLSCPHTLFFFFWPKKHMQTWLFLAVAA